MNGVFKYVAKSFLLFIYMCNLFTSWSSVCVNLVCDCLERDNVWFFSFFFFFLTCLIHAPLCLRLYPGRSGGEQWAVNVF